MLFKIFSQPFQCQIESVPEYFQMELIGILESFVPNSEKLRICRMQLSSTFIDDISKQQVS